MLECTDRHGSADLIEEYCLDRLPPAELVWFETHLMVCGICRKRVSDTDELIVCLKLALGRESPFQPQHITPEENSHVVG